MTSLRPTQPLYGVVAGLGLVVVALSVVGLVAMPSSLAPTRVAVALILVLALMLVGLAVAGYRGITPDRTRTARRAVLLVAGAVGAVGVLSLAPLLAEVLRHLAGDGAAVLGTVVLVLVAAGLAGLCIWASVRVGETRQR